MELDPTRPANPGEPVVLAEIEGLGTIVTRIFD